MDGLYCLLEEAEECRWLLPLPEPTHTLIRDGIAKGRRQGSLITSHRAGHLIQQMQQAVDRGDVHAARRYASRWRKQKTSIRLPPDAPSRSSGNRLASRIESGRLPVIPRQVDQPSTIQCPFCKTELAIDSKLSSQQFFCSCGQLLQMRSRSATRGVT